MASAGSSTFALSASETPSAVTQGLWRAESRPPREREVLLGALPRVADRLVGRVDEDLAA